MTSVGYLVVKSDPTVTVGTAIAQAGSTSAILVRSVPAIMLAISPIASGISPFTAAGGMPSIAPAMSRAALAAGADGLLVEVHPDPPSALSDGQQSLDFPTFQALYASLKPLAEVLQVDVL